jgi:hypothetical protein
MFTRPRAPIDMYSVQASSTDLGVAAHAPPHAQAPAFSLSPLSGQGAQDAALTVSHGSVPWYALSLP